MSDTRPEFTTEATAEEMLIYLDDLRDSGETNMFGAGAYLEREFELSRSESGEMLSYWMRTFSERHPN